MATQFDVKPGTFETINGESLGAFTLNVWTHFKLGSDAFKHLLASPDVKQGGGSIPVSAYELATDGDATNQESTYTGETLYGQMRIVNATYAGVELTVDAKNYGGYVSNEAMKDYVDGVGSGNTSPGSDAYIEEGELAQFDSDTGLSIVSDNSGEIALYDPGTSYSVAGTLARIEGLTATATGAASNQNKYPLLAWNNSYWYLPKNERELLNFANSGEAVIGEVHPIHDRAGVNYNQNIKVGKRDVNGTQYEFHLIHLDGSIVTGNTTLETILGVGESWQNPYIDIIAPDDLGTRTLIDAGGDTFRAQEAATGDFDTVGAKVGDQFQGHWHDVDKGDLFVGGSSFTRSAFMGDSTSGLAPSDYIKAKGYTEDTDNSYGTPRPGTRTYGPTLVTGAAYIISMVPA